MAFFQKRDILTAIEIGTSKICVLVGELDEQSQVTIIGHGEKALFGAVRKGEIIDMDTVSDALFSAITDAEQTSGINVDNSSVYVAVTGSHISSQQSNGSVIITGDDKNVTGDHVAEATENAKFLPLLPGNSVINYFDSYYLIDGKRRLANPVGHVAHKLDAYVHIIYGDQNRIENFKSIVNEIGIEVQVEPVFSAVASAYGALSEEEDKQGVLLVEMGAGTTEFMVFKDSGVRHSGVLPIGCDHIANDLSLGLDITFSTASTLLTSKEYDYHKRKGDAFMELSGTIRESHRKIPLASIDKIIDSRLRETAQIIFDKVNDLSLVSELSMGIVLSGGGALISLAPEILNSVFRTPVRVAKPTGMNGPSSFETPRYTTVCGLLKCGLTLKEAERVNRQKGVVSRTSSLVSQLFSPVINTINDIRESIKF